MPSYLIGRGERNDVVLSNTTVSRQHAELIDEGSGAYRLRDLGSINGTFLFWYGWLGACDVCQARRGRHGSHWKIRDVNHRTSRFSRRKAYPQAEG